MLDKIYEISFQIILHAGDARTKALQAIQQSNLGEAEEAKALLNEAKQCLKLAHKQQTELIQQEANGEKLELNVMLVHGQDHFSMAMTSIDLAEQMLKMNEKMYSLELKVKMVSL